MKTPITVEQITDVDVFTVQVTLDPAQIIEALAEALRGKAEKLMLIRALPPEHSSRLQAFADLRALLADVFTITLLPAQAETLSYALDDACDLPDQCAWCESYSVVKIDGVHMCHRHARAHDRAAEESAS